MTYRLVTIHNNRLYYLADYIDEDMTKLKWSAHESKAMTFLDKDKALRFKRIYLNNRKDVFLNEHKVIH